MAVKDLFKQELKIINIGLESFYNDLRAQNVSAVQVDWRPKAGGNAKMASLLGKLKKKSQ